MSYILVYIQIYIHAVAFLKPFAADQSIDFIPRPRPILKKGKQEDDNVSSSNNKSR